jgi:hypothetical protein
LETPARVATSAMVGRSFVICIPGLRV